MTEVTRLVCKPYARGEIVAMITTSRTDYLAQPAETREVLQLVEVVALSRDRFTITAIRESMNGQPRKLAHMTCRRPQFIFIGMAPTKSLPNGSGGQPAARRMFASGHSRFDSAQAARDAIGAEMLALMNEAA